MARDPRRGQTEASARAADARKQRFAVRVKRETQWRRLRDRLPRASTLPVLDVGGGTGYWALRVAGEGPRVVLTDVSVAALTVAREKVEAAGLAGRIELCQAGRGAGTTCAASCATAFVARRA